MPIDHDRIIETARKYTEKGRFDRAIEEYQKLLKESPDNARVLLIVGDLYSQQGQYEAAISTYEKVADLYRKNQTWVKAIAVYNRIRENIRKRVPHLSEQYAYIAPRLAELYQHLNLNGDAMAMYDEYAVGLTNAGRYREAVEVFRKIVELDPRNALARMRLGEALLRISEEDEALDNFAAASEIFLGLNRPDHALRIIERLLSVRPDKTWTRKAAELYLERNNEQDARKALQKVQILFTADKEDIDSLLLLARALEQLGDTSKVVEVKLETARVAQRKGKSSFAKQLAVELLRVAPNNKDVLAFANSLTQSRSGSSSVDAGKPRAQQTSHQSSIVATEDAEIEVSEAFIELDDDEEIDLSDDASAIAALGKTGLRPEFNDVPQTRTDAQQPVYAQEEIEQQAAPTAEAAYYQEPSQTGAAYIDEVLANAEAYLGQGDIEGALETVRVGLSQDPTAFELRYAFKDLLYQVGDYTETVKQLITLAAIYLDASDEESAGRMLEEAFALAPQHPRVRAMLLDLGYELPEQEEPAQQQQDAYAQSDDDDAAMSLAQDTAEPLPSYDLEDVDTNYGVSGSSIPSPGAAALLSTDDPFAVNEVRQQQASAIGTSEIDEPFGETDNRLPSFPLLTTADDIAAGSDAYEAQSTYPDDVLPVAEENYEPRQPMATVADPDPPFAGSQSQRLRLVEQDDLDTETPGFAEGETLEGALEQADLYAARGMYDEAFAVLNLQLETHPNHPLLMERQREIEEMRTEEMASGRPPGMAEQPVYDLDVSLKAIDEVIVAESNPPPSADQTVDVDEVFAQFKAGVAEQVAESDSQTHYDLGIAYKEMGLLDDAIQELELATQGREKECISWSLIGMIRREQGDVDNAIGAFLRGLHARIKTADQEKALYYELGQAYEEKGRNQEALYYFDTVASQDAGYRDAQQRAQALRELSGRRRKPRSGEVQDEPFENLDQAFDDVFGGGN